MDTVKRYGERTEVLLLEDSFHRRVVIIKG